MSEGLPKFTPREKQVLILIAEGKTNVEIAIELNISIKTVDTHLNRMLLRAGLSNRKQLVDRFGDSTNSKDNNQDNGDR